MALSDIKEKLYKKDAEQVEKMDTPVLEIAGAQNISEAVPGENLAGDEWESKKPEMGAERKKIIKIAAGIVGGIIAVLLIFFGIYKYRQSAFSEEKVAFAISGPAESESGQMVYFKIAYSNENRVSLENAEIVLSYPENFKPEANLNFTENGTTTGTFSLGEIKSRSFSETVFSGKAYSPRGTLMYIKAELRYTPSNNSSQFAAKSQAGISLTSSPLVIEALAPQNMPSGDSIDYVITYKNTGQDSLEGIKIKAEYSEDFSFSNSNPNPSIGNNVWNIGRISEGQEGKIVISGKLEGSRGEVRGMKISIGVERQGQFVAYNESRVETKIIASPLAILQTVNGGNEFTAKAGDTLMFNLSYRNEGDIGLRDVIIAQRIDSPVLDYETLNLTKGAFDINNKVIIWKASDYPELRMVEPGQEGSVNFSIKVKDTIPVKNAEDKNFIISAVAKIDSPDIPTPIEMNKIIAGNRLDIKLNSKLILDVKGFYNDSFLSNSGPIPPQVGQDTTYTIHWKATNVSNDISDAKVETVLPTGVSMVGTFPADAKIAYNARNNSVVWELGDIAAGTGILSAVKEVVFQVKINPAPAQVGNTVELVGTSTFSAKDLFTGENLSVASEGKNTNLMEDAGIGNNNKVVN